MDLNGGQVAGHPSNPTAFVDAACAHGACTLDLGTGADVATGIVCVATDGVGCVLAGIVDGAVNVEQDVADHRGAAAVAVDLLTIGVVGSGSASPINSWPKKRQGRPRG